MKKKFLTLACIASVGLLASVQALEVKKPEVGALKNVTSAVTNTASALTPAGVKGTISGINEKLITTDKTTQEAFNSLVAALSSKEEAAKIKAKLNAINNNKNLSASEKSAKLAEVMSDYGNVLKENQEKLGNELKAANEAKRKKIANSIIALAVTGYEYVDIANDCTHVAMSVSANPTLAVSLASELKDLKDTGIILKNNAKSLKNVTTQAVAVAKAGGIEVKLPKSNKSKASKVDLNLSK